MHHFKHNKVLHHQIVLLTMSMLNTPTISEGEPIEVQPLGGGFYRVIARFGSWNPLTCRSPWRAPAQGAVV